MTTADRLRQAAQKIREATATVRPVSHTQWQRTDASAHVALWSPPVALAVAAWLEREAADEDEGLRYEYVSEAYVFADLILGGDK